MRSTKTLICKEALNCSGKTAAYQINKRLRTNEPKVMFLALGLLDMLMDKCATPFHAQIGTKDFMQVLIVTLNNKQMQQEVSTSHNTIRFSRRLST